MTTVRLLADDLTGALDTAAELVGLTGPIHAFWHGAIPPRLQPNAALDSGTREVDTTSAIAVTAALTPALAAGEIAFKKVDSLMRGPTLAEAAACFAAGPWTMAVCAPAFPFQGRVTRGGQQYSRGATGPWQPVGTDIVDCLRAAGATAHRGVRDGALRPGITVFDAETEDDLLRIAALSRAVDGQVLWIGTGGLAQALAAPSGNATSTDLPGPVLGLFGSDQAVTAGQLAACGPDWVKLQDGGPAAALALTAMLRATGRALVSLNLPEGVARRDAARCIDAEFRRLVARLDPPGTLLIAGGETLRNLCLALGAQSLEVHGRIVPGLPRSILRGGRWDGVTVVSKSGAFGTPTLLRDLLHTPHPATERTA